MVSATARKETTMRPQQQQQQFEVDWSLVAMGVTLLVAIVLLFSQLA
jgi:hypothetical protein